MSVIKAVYVLCTCTVYVRLRYAHITCSIVYTLTGLYVLRVRVLKTACNVCVKFSRYDKCLHERV